jgi:hypothetical protein
MEDLDCGDPPSEVSLLRASNGALLRVERFRREGEELARIMGCLQDFFRWNGKWIN